MIDSPLCASMSLFDYYCRMIVVIVPDSVYSVSLYFTCLDTVTALVPYDFLTRVFAMGAPFMGDYTSNNQVPRQTLKRTCVME